MNRKYTNKRYLENNPGLRAPRMEHIRNIKPELFSHEGVAAMSPLARLAWIGLWTQADKFGRFPWRPKLLKTKLLPYDEVDFESLLGEMLAGGFIEKYTAEGEDYGLVVHWERHQGLGTHEQHSAFSYPPPSAELNGLNSSRTVQEQFTHKAFPVGVGVGVEVGVGASVGKEVGEREGVSTAAAAPAAAETSLSPSLPAAQTPARHETATPGINVPKAVAYIIERAKVSENQAQFSENAKQKLADALQELGAVSKPELTEAIQAKLKLCSAKDATSYVIFGVQFADNLVASVRDIRRRNEAAKVKAQVAEILDKQFEWKEQCYAAAKDLSINLEDWLDAHTSPIDEALVNDMPHTLLARFTQDGGLIDEDEATKKTAREIRETLLQKQNAAPQGTPTPLAAPAKDEAQRAETAPNSTLPAKRQTETTIIGKSGEHQGHALSSNNNGGSVRCRACNRFLSDAEAEIAWPIESGEVAAD